MAKYRQIHTSFWQDGFVLDLTPEEKYFYIYLMTNSKTSQCGIYELPKRVIEIETGYNNETILKLLQRFVDYKKIDYFEGTKEIMLLNWNKYNSIVNLNLLKRVVSELEDVKYKEFANRYISTLDSDLEFDKEGLVRGLQVACNVLGSNRIKSKEQGIKNKEFLSDSSEYRLADFLYQQILKNNPKFKEPNLQTWSKGFDAILRIDKREFEETKQVIEWCQNDNFWKANMLSPGSLRKHYDKFLVKINSKGAASGNSKQNNGTNSSNNYDFSKYTG